MTAAPLPHFPYHRDPTDSGAIKESDAPCECCGKSRGVLYDGVIYSQTHVDSLCPWCIADGSATGKFGAEFFDGYFCDDRLNPVYLPETLHRAVFGCTIGFATYNPIGWWVHCGEPAEYVTREEPYDMIFECRVCGLRHAIQDFS